MEFKKKLDFDVKDADYAVEVPPRPATATVVPAVMLAVFILVPVVMIGLIVWLYQTFNSPMLIVPIVFVVVFIVAAAAMFCVLFRGLKRQKMPALLIQGNTIAAQYRNGWYCLHKSEIKSVTIAETPGGQPEVFEPADPGRADVLVSNIGSGVNHIRGYGYGSVTAAGVVSFVSNTVTFAVPTQSALGAVRRIADLVTRD